MKLSYFRKSKYSLEETIKNLLENTSKQNWKIIGEATFPDNSGKMILICKPEWVKILLEKDSNLIGFLPCAISIFKKGKDIMIGSGQPNVIQALTQNKEIALLAEKAEKLIKDLIHVSAGVEELKPKHVKLYSTMTCPYCKMEKSWLDENKVKHDIVYVDLNPSEGQKMVEKTGQMGVPVTEIQYEEEESEYIVGFDKTRLSQILGL